MRKLPTALSLDGGGKRISSQRSDSGITSESPDTGVVRIGSEFVAFHGTEYRHSRPDRHREVDLFPCRQRVFDEHQWRVDGKALVIIGGGGSPAEHSVIRWSVATLRVSRRCRNHGCPQITELHRSRLTGGIMVDGRTPNMKYGGQSGGSDGSAIRSQNRFRGRNGSVRQD